MEIGNRVRRSRGNHRHAVRASVMAAALFVGPLAATAVAQSGSSPRVTASALYKAWRGRDRTAARKVADSTVVTKLFARSASGPAWTFVKCLEMDEPDPHFECSYRYRGGRAVLDVSDSDAFGLFVTGIRFAKS
jgi:hypothetical protein